MRTARIVVLFLASIFIGALGGGLLSTFFMHSENGWDRLADFYGGLFIGAGVGLAFAIVVLLVNRKDRSSLKDSES